MNYNDSELINELASGNTGAFDQLYRDLYPALCLLSYKIAGSEDIARDIVADVFLQLWEGRASLQHIQNIKAYLYISARNKTLNYLKTKSFSARETSDESISALQPTADAFFQDLLHVETVRVLRQAVADLPPECKKVMELVLKGHSTNEIAEILDISPSAVSHQKTRAVRLLREKILPALLAAIVMGHYAS